MRKLVNPSIESYAVPRIQIGHKQLLFDFSITWTPASSLVYGKSPVLERQGQLNERAGASARTPPCTHLKLVEAIDEGGRPV